MLQKPQLKKCYHLASVGSEGIVLMTEHQNFWLSGDAFSQLSPYLTGEYTTDQILGALVGRLSMPEIFYALSVLEQQGYVVEAEDTLPDAQLAYWHALGVGAAAVHEQLAKWQLELINLCDPAVGEAVEQALAAAGLPRHARGNLRLVVVPDYDLPELEQINRDCLAAGIPWLLVKPVGTEVWIGPLVEPGTTACWACLVQRVAANRQMHSYVKSLNGGAVSIQTSMAALPATVQLALSMAVTQLSQWLVAPKTKPGSLLHNRLLTLNTLALETTYHSVVRLPQCRACGSPEHHDRSRPAAPIRLQSQKKKFRNDGGHRSSSPEETYERYKHHISPITGVVSNLTRLDRYGDQGLIYTYAAGHNFAMMSHRGMFFMMKNLRGRSGGKGMADLQAKLSGMCEAIERYSGVFRGDEVAVKTTARALGDRALRPDSYLLFSDAQYANRDEWNRVNDSDYHKVPLLFPEDRPLEWSTVWSLTRQEARYVPTGYCYFGHPDIQDYYYAASDANGNAAGNTLEEAILQGFLELVERDSVALWWYNRVQRPAVDLASFELPYVDKLVTFYAQNHREIWVLDITTDLTIPTFAAVSRRTDKAVEDIVLGFGSHLDPKIALLRALTEVNQFMPCVSNANGQGDTEYWYDDPEAIAWWKTATLASQPYLVPDPAARVRTLADYADLSTDDLKTDVERCVALAAGIGMETFVLDQTRPDIGLSVAKVMVPGMRHFWKRFAPGRLYETPVKLGWLDAPKTEAELNPIGIFF